MEPIVNNVIEELSKINQAASEFAQNMEDAKEKLAAEYEQKKKEYSEKLVSDATGRVEKLREELKEANNKKIGELHSESEAYMARLDRDFEANHSQWAQEIVNKIITER